MGRREDGPGVFVVDFEPGLHGPFDDADVASSWAAEYARRTWPGFDSSWCVIRVREPEEGSHERR